jgi:hypothetical protein
VRGRVGGLESFQLFINFSILQLVFGLSAAYLVASGLLHDALAQPLLAGLETIAPAPLLDGRSNHGGSPSLTLPLELWIAGGLVQNEGGDLGVRRQ